MAAIIADSYASGVSGAVSQGNRDNGSSPMGPRNRLTEGFLAGSLSGAAIGGILGWFPAVDATTFPGVVHSLSPSLLGIFGMALGAAIGGITGAMIGIGVPQFEGEFRETVSKTSRQAPGIQRRVPGNARSH